MPFQLMQDSIDEGSNKTLLFGCLKVSVINVELSDASGQRIKEFEKTGGTEMEGEGSYKSFS